MLDVTIETVYVTFAKHSWIGVERTLSAAGSDCGTAVQVIPIEKAGFCCCKALAGPSVCTLHA